jgi:hypothetical protein
MLVFPQVITGGAGLYPITKYRVQRTVRNQLSDGRTDTYSDTAAAYTVWQIDGKGLTRQEWDAIEGLFVQASGSLNTFTFLDPVGNLLTNSESLADNVWLKTAGLQLTTGVTDPLGTPRASKVVNAVQASGTVEQALAIPGSFHYCMSGWFRTTSGSKVALAIDAGTNEISQTFDLGAQWQRVFLSGNPHEAPATSVTFAIRLLPGAMVEVFGLQAEAQLAPSEYKFTGPRGGVYKNARFATDQVVGRAQATDIHDTVIRVVSTEN